MRYWLFHNNQVAGPYDREELVQTPGFGADALVCPEGRKGTQMGDWQRAGIVSELAEALLRSSKIPTLTLASSGGSAGLLPPEPTLRDLAVLGSLQEKVQLLENVLGQLQEDLRARDQETSQLKVQLELKSQESATLSSKLTDMEARLIAAESLKEELLRARQEERETAESLKQGLSKVQADDRTAAEAQAAQAQALEALRGKFESSQEELKRQIDEIDRRQNAASSVLPPPAPEPFRAPPAAVLPAQAPVQTAAPLPALEPAPAAAAVIAPEPLPAFTPPAEHPPALESAPAPLTAFPAGDAVEQASPSYKEKAAQEDAASQLSTGAPPAKKTSKGKLMAVAAVLVLSAGAGAAYHLGLFNSLLGKGPSAPSTQEPQASLPDMPSASPTTLSPESARQGLPDRTLEAVELVKAFRFSGKGRSLAQRLEGPEPAHGLSPWTVDRIAEDRYQVKFYDRASGEKTPRYSFEARLMDRSVLGLDERSKEILSSSSQPPTKAGARSAKKPAAADAVKTARSASEPKARRAARKKAAPKDDLLQDPLGSLLMESSLEEEKPAAQKKTPAAEEEGTALPPEDVYDEESSQDSSARTSAPAKTGKSAARQSKEESTLDELLLPGVPKQ
ncbi:MAG: hypothetical protein WCU88_05850 [Elusimicrobiota bacterium]|jgi:hypothetical protein